MWWGTSLQVKFEETDNRVRVRRRGAMRTRLERRWVNERREQVRSTWNMHRNNTCTLSVSIYFWGCFRSFGSLYHVFRNVTRVRTHKKTHLRVEQYQQCIHATFTQLPLLLYAFSVSHTREIVDHCVLVMVIIIRTKENATNAHATVMFQMQSWLCLDNQSRFSWPTNYLTCRKHVSYHIRQRFCWHLIQYLTRFETLLVQNISTGITFFVVGHFTSEQAIIMNASALFNLSFRM